LAHLQVSHALINLK